MSPWLSLLKDGDHYINRRTLIVHPFSHKCRLTDTNTNIEQEMKSILNKINKL